MLSIYNYKKKMFVCFFKGKKVKIKKGEVQSHKK